MDEERSMMNLFHEMFRGFGGLSLVSLGAIALGELMLLVETSVRDLLRKCSDRGAR
jgi:hypothetical protein